MENTERTVYALGRFW